MQRLCPILSHVKKGFVGGGLGGEGGLEGGGGLDGGGVGGGGDGVTQSLEGLQ